MKLVLNKKVSFVLPVPGLKCVHLELLKYSIFLSNMLHGNMPTVKSSKKYCPNF